MQFLQCLFSLKVCKFTVTVCEADSTTSRDSDCTVIYDSDSSISSVCSGPMFIEDNSDTDDNLPKIKPCSVDTPSALLPLCSPVAPGAPASQAVPTSTTEKCQCYKSGKEKVFFFFIEITFFFVFFLPFFFYNLSLSVNI